MEKEWTISEKELFEQLKSDKNGLAQSDVDNRIIEFGKNVIKKKKSYKIPKIIWSQINSPLICILILAAIVSFFAESKLDAYVIGVIVLINSGIGFFQQYRAENAIQKLSSFLIPKVHVFRDGALKIVNSSEIVPGDLVVLEEGDKITADMRIISSEGLKVNESILTGESIPVEKKKCSLSSDISIEKRVNMVFAGTEILIGRATALVVKTGDNTVFGSLAQKLQDMKIQKTPMQKRIDKFSKQVGAIIIGLVGLIFVLGLYSDSTVLELIMVSITLAVGAIPEGLPAVMAIAFSISSNIMTKNNVIIRRLPAVEGLGSVTVICTDKTGTLTKEKMEVQQLYVDDSKYSKIKNDIFLDKEKVNVKKNRALSKIIKIALLSSNARFEKGKKKIEYFGDPTEKVLIKTGLEFGFDKKYLAEAFPRLKTFNFDAKRKMMSILRDNGRNNILYTKGAPEKVLEICGSELIDGQIKRLSAKRREEIKKHIRSMENSALRVLGFAYKNFAKREIVEEKSLIFVGAMGMIDPPRDEVKKAIEECKNAGIKIKMITGDSLITGRTIAKKIGIVGEAINSDELAKMSDEELLNRIDDYGVFTRATPEQKLRIARILQKKGETIAMTGDGVNDVLALKSADVGIAMGIRGTDVARDVSDIILKDDNFASIVKGVKYGRITYDNIKKFIKYMLSVNFSMILLVTITSLMGMPIPILPIQILWKNIITDSFPALSLIFEKGEDVMNTPPRKEKNILANIWPFIVGIGLLNLMVSGGVYFYGMNRNLNINFVRSLVMMVGIIFELTFIYTCRTNDPLRLKGFFSNRYLNISILFAVLLNIILMYTKLGVLFKITPFSLGMWLVLVPLGLTGLLVNEIVKEVRYRRKKA